MRLTVAGLRILAALAAVAAVAAQYGFSLAQGPVNPTKFFGYFTIQSNLLTAAVLAIAAIAGLSRRSPRQWLTVARLCVTTYMATTGVVYALLLRGTATTSDFNLPWADTMLHVVLPLYAVADWVLFGDRTPVPWRRAWIVLAYPAVWVAATLMRGSLLDGFYAYPFLDPQSAGGIAAVALYIAATAAFILAIGVLGVWVGRLRPMRP